MRTIDCRQASAQRPRSAVVGRILQAGALGIGGLLVLAVLVTTVHLKPSVAKSTQAPSAQPASAPAAAPEPSRAETATTDADVRSDGGLDYLSMKTEAEEKLRGVLTDDQGLRVRDVHTKLSTLDGGGVISFCGEENSRTPLGGYGGFQRFIASRSVATTESQMEPAEFAQAWSQFCENAAEGPQVWF